MRVRRIRVRGITGTVGQAAPAAGIGIVSLGHTVTATQGGTRATSENKRQIYA